jgi:hypothetical protein
MQVEYGLDLPHLSPRIQRRRDRTSGRGGVRIL